MRYMAVRIYGNGQFMNMAYPVTFKYLSAAQNLCREMEKREDIICNENRWIPFPLMEDDSPNWEGKK